MKHANKRLCLHSLSLLVIAFLLSSCDRKNYHFTRPQPVDAANIYAFPKAFRGIWIEADDTTVVGKDYYKRTSIKKNVIVPGVWLDPTVTKVFETLDSVEKKKMIKRYANYHSFNKIQYDSLHNPIDTIPGYILKDNRIYEKHDDSQLEMGFPFVKKGDTIYFTSMRKDGLQLGRDIFLRRISESYYVLNIADEFPEGLTDQWWQIILLENTGKRIVVNFLKAEVEDYPGFIHKSGADDYYLDSQWTKQDMLKRIGAGDFSYTVMNLEKTKSALNQGKDGH